MPNIDLKYARSNTTGTNDGGANRRGEERGRELLSDRNGSPSVRPSVASVRLAVAGCSSRERTVLRIRHEIVGKDILREKPLLSISLGSAKEHGIGCVNSVLR